MEGLPSKGYKTYEIVEQARAEESPFVIEAQTLDTPYYKIVLDEEGLFTSIYDKRNDREVLQEGEKGNLFRMYEDKPIYYDNWDIDIYYTEKSWDVKNLNRMEWVSNGPVCTILELERVISNSLIRQRIYFYADMARFESCGQKWMDLS